MIESREKRMKMLLEEHFQPTVLDVIDESSKHIGHAGAQPEGETHYRLVIVCAGFQSLKAIQRHRLVNDLLAKEFENGLHALSIKALTPQEFESR